MEKIKTISRKILTTIIEFGEIYYRTIIITTIGAFLIMQVQTGQGNFNTAGKIGLLWGMTSFLIKPILE